MTSMLLAADRNTMDCRRKVFLSGIKTSTALMRVRNGRCWRRFRQVTILAYDGRGNFNTVVACMQLLIYFFLAILAGSFRK
jgi:hypothetical protein